MTTVLRGVLPLLLAAVLCAVSGCGDDDARASDGPKPTESAEDFARRAFAEMDVAATCPELERVWDSYLDPATRAVVRRLVPCNRKVLAATYPLDSVRDFDYSMYIDIQQDRPAAVADADEIHEVELDAPEPNYADSFTYEYFLGDSWLVLTTGAEHTLFNTTLDVLDACVETEEGCHFAG